LENSEIVKILLTIAGIGLLIGAAISVGLHSMFTYMEYNNPYGYYTGLRIASAVGTVILLGAGIFVLWLGRVKLPPIIQFREQRGKILKLARTHDTITIEDISARTGIPLLRVNDILHLYIAKGKLPGSMEGHTYVRVPGMSVESGPAPISATERVPEPKQQPVFQTVPERESLDGYVICPYCSAKTQAGLPKCQNCGAELKPGAAW
jgi:hypothetical protein